jgi:hypothetical protein
VPSDSIPGEALADVSPPATKPAETPDEGSFKRARFSTLPDDASSFRSIPLRANAARYFSPNSR